MELRDHTIAIVLDEQHAQEFARVLPNWLEFHPELRECRWLISQHSRHTTEFAGMWEVFKMLPRAISVPWLSSPKDFNHRELALWQYLAVIPTQVTTTRWTKIDTDCIATPHATGDAFLQLGAGCAVTGSPWGYTKPPGALEQLGEWVKSNWPDAELPAHRTVDGKDKCRRLIGWLSTHDTAYTQELARVCAESPPPVISHDTLTWLVAEATGRKVGDYPYKLCGWDHVRPRHLQQRLHAMPAEPAVSKHAARVIELCRSIDARKAVEVGVYRGETSAAILHHCPDLHLTMVDPWAEQPAGDYRASGDQRARDSKVGHDLSREIAIASVQHHIHGKRCQPIRDRSTTVATEFRRAGRQWDLVFIDAAHDYQSVVEDIAAWRPLVRQGGILCGHDYGHRRYRGVKQAVDEFAEKCGLKLQVDREATVWWVQL